MTARSNVSREQRAAWGRLGGLSTAATHTPEQRQQMARIGAKARAAKYTSEQLRQIHANQLRTRLARMTPEQVCDFQRKAAQGRWRGVTADEHSKISRKAMERRLGQVAYAKNQEKADRLYTFLREYISAKRCAPTKREMCHAMRRDKGTVKSLLQILERIGRAQQHGWNRGRGITLSPLGAQPALALSFGGGSAPQGSEAIAVPRPTKKCYQCDDPAVAGKTRCELHLTRVREACERSYAKQRAAGRCVQCGALTVEGKALCDRHRETRNRSYAKKRTVGGCVECSALAVEGKTRCERHLVLHRESCNRSYAKKRTAQT